MKVFLIFVFAFSAFSNEKFEKEKKALLIENEGFEKYNLEERYCIGNATNKRQLQKCKNKNREREFKEKEKKEEEPKLK